jgi:hypothetical protein
MLITILEVAALLAIIIVPLKGPSKKKEKKSVLKIDRDVSDAHYAINSDGYLEEIHGRELSSHQH